MSSSTINVSNCFLEQKTLSRCYALIDSRNRLDCDLHKQKLLVSQSNRNKYKLTLLLELPKEKCICCECCYRLFPVLCAVVMVHLSVVNVHVIQDVMARSVNVTAPRVPVMSHSPNVSSK